MPSLARKVISTVSWLVDSETSIQSASMNPSWINELQELLSIIEVEPYYLGKVKIILPSDGTVTLVISTFKFC